MLDSIISYTFCLFLLIFIISLFATQDIWFNLGFLMLPVMSFLFSTSTSTFIIWLYIIILISLLFEISTPEVIFVGYFFFAVISKFILSRTQDHLGGNLQAYYIFLIGTSFILGFLNIIGLLPFSSVLTGQFIFAFYFSILYFIVNLICGILYHQNKLFNLFLPKGVPFFIVPILIIIEAISFFSRVLSLAIRLCANILAGHILLKILVSFLNLILRVHISFSFPSALAFGGIIIIIILEAFIGILQVYIFNLLLVIYINGVLDLH